MPIIGKPRTFQKKHKFIVEIDSVAFAGYQSCSELTSEIAETQYFEGGSSIANKSPGRQTFSDVTLMRAAVEGDLDMYLWHQQVVEAQAQAGLEEPEFKRNLDIVQLGNDGKTKRRWRLFNAWPKSFTAGAWDNDSDDNVIESVTLCYDYFTLITG
jgi:phage tail-like protein